MTKKTAYILNPISGTHNKNRIIAHLEKLRDINKNITVYLTKSKGDATTQAKKFVEEGFNTVVAVGGDGTVNEVAQALMHTNTALGIIPCGSGNGLARHLHIPLNMYKAIDIIETGKVTDIDCGKMNDKYFFCTAGVGFDAQVGHLFAQAKGRGLLTYAQTTINEFFRYKTNKYKITLEDGTSFMRTAFLITFANASQWGNNAYIAPSADVSDGVLDMVIMSPFNLVDAPLVGLRMFTKSLHHSRNIEVFKFKEVTIERELGGYIHIDGEAGIDGNILKVTNIHKALKVIIPQHKLT